jgi:hypothetical protein
MSTVKKRPQLNLDELLLLKWGLGGALTLLALSTVVYMDVDAWLLMLATAGACVATLVKPVLPARVPPIAHTLTFPVVAAFFAADLWLKTEVLPAMVRLDILLLLYRTVTHRQRRDDLQILVLGLFLIVVAGVLTVSIWFIVHILVYAGIALAFLLTITLTEAARENAAGEGRHVPGAPPPAWASHADWRTLLRRLREIADWRVVGLGAALFAGVVVVSGLLFLAIPRFQIENSLFLDRFITKKARAGFSETIRIGQVAEIQQDSSVALTVDVADPASIPAMPYWRMLVLNEYRDGTFTRGGAGMFGRVSEGTSVRGTAEARGGGAAWTFYLEAGVSRYLPLLGRFSGLRFQEPQSFQQAGATNLVALRSEPVTMTAYLVRDFDLSDRLPDAAFAAQWERRGNDPRAVASQQRLPRGEADRAMLRRIALEIAGADDGAENMPGIHAAEFAQRVGEWLRNRHGYSLTPRIPPGDGDPLVRWLTSRESGHCELFAGACVLLARAAGLPARAVVGFKGGTWNGFSQSFSVRNSEAHAWAEVFDAATGEWLRTDPLAPPSTAAAGPDGSAAARTVAMDRSWSARFDSLRVFWYRRIVNFDQRSQAATLKSIKAATENAGRRFRMMLDETGERIRRWLAGPWDRDRWLTVVGSVAAGWLLGAIVRRYFRGWWRLVQRAPGRRTDPVRREAGRLLRQLASDGGEAAVVEDVGRVTGQLQRLRFGASETWPEPEAVFRRARRLSKHVRRVQRRSDPAAGATV